MCIFSPLSPYLSTNFNAYPKHGLTQSKIHDIPYKLITRTKQQTSTTAFNFNEKKWLQ